jgi:tetratricopeptide (TPR) repeat protein
MNTEALKEQARRHEQREEWLKAIEMYGKAVDQLAHDDQPDLSLYNRLGDLEVRVGNVERGVEHYEQAIDLYIEAELPNNAIAICRKVVRNLPTRHGIFLKMGQIRARQGFLTDARTNFLEYAERMQKAQDLEEAFRALIEFVELAPEDIEARRVLAGQLEAHERTPEAIEQYISIHQRLTAKDRLDEAQGIEEKIRELDPTTVIPGPERPSPGPTVGDEGLMGFETTALVDDFPILDAQPPAGEEEDAIDPGAFEIATDVSDDADAVPDEEESADEHDGAVAFDGGLSIPPELGEASAELADGGGVEEDSDETTFADLGLSGASFEVEGDAGGAEPKIVSAPPSEETGSEPLFEDTGSDTLFGEEGSETPFADAVSEDAIGVAEGIGGGLGEPAVESLEDPSSVEPAAETPPADLAPWAVDHPLPPKLAAAEVVDAPAGATDGDQGTLGPDDPLPLISFEDDETEVAPSGEEGGLAAADFGVRDDEGRDQEYLEPAEEMEELEADLVDVGSPGEMDTVGSAPLGDPEQDLVTALQAQLEADPGNGDTWLALAQEFFALGRGEEGTLAIDQAIQRFEGASDHDGPIRAMRTLVDREPDTVDHRQRLVELAIRKNDESVLTSAYLDLADCLVRNGDGELARGVYQQILLTDPDNTAAAAGLGALEEAPVSPAREVASSEDYVDLGSLILDDEEEKTTRWKVAAEEPSGDEEADFAKMLSQFKDKVAENLEADDLAAHYDLGTAYKEMGLVDEAIYEFQQALRAESDHLPTHELLGQCFMEKGQFEVAVRSMNRALDSATEVEDELLGIYYQMARAHEELGNKGDALEFYEKVFALDINFQDVTERLRVLR